MQRSALALGEFLQKRMGEQRGVTLAVTHRRDIYHDFAYAIEQVLAEPSGFDERREILMSGADNAHIDGDFFAPTDALKHPFLEEAQQFRL